MQNLMGCSIKGPSLITDHSPDRMSDKVSSFHETLNARLSQDKLNHCITFMHTSANSLKVCVFLEIVSITKWHLINWRICFLKQAGAGTPGIGPRNIRLD